MYTIHTIWDFYNIYILVCFQMSSYISLSHQYSFYQALTDHLHLYHHKCSNVFHLSLITFIFIIGYYYQLRCQH